jgi:hypothetical protein
VVPWQLYVPPLLTLTNSIFCSRSACVSCNSHNK